MKFKKCSFCTYEGTMYRSKPLCCRNCAMRLDAQQSVEQTSPVKKKGIAQFSDKMLKELAIYRIKRIAFLKANPVCQAQVKCNGSKADQVHHKRGRIGKLITDERYFLAGCGPCHKWINEHNEEAFALGLSESRLSTTN